jgi:hypothetical protein
MPPKLSANALSPSSPAGEVPDRQCVVTGSCRMACVKRAMMPFTSGTKGCKRQKTRRSSLAQLPRHESWSQPTLTLAPFSPCGRQAPRRLFSSDGSLSALPLFKSRSCLPTCQTWVSCSSEAALWSLRKLAFAFAPFRSEAPRKNNAEGYRPSVNTSRSLLWPTKRKCQDLTVGRKTQGGG